MRRIVKSSDALGLPERRIAEARGALALAPVKRKKG